MFRNLLTPLTSKFPALNSTPDVPESIAEAAIAPEDVERDARIEEMRLVLEDMKTVSPDDIFRKYQVGSRVDVHRAIYGRQY
jgi:hypothetical protein